MREYSTLEGRMQVSLGLVNSMIDRALITAIFQFRLTTSVVCEEFTSLLFRRIRCYMYFHISLERPLHGDSLLLNSLHTCLSFVKQCLLL